jgi:putative alpha-1,2-mannosidase
LPSRFAVVVTAVLASVTPMTTVAAQPAGDPTELVNPFIGTGTGGQFVGSVNTFPGAVAPFGMLSWSPETSSRPTGGGYNYDDSAVTGLSLTHLSGVGCPIHGDLPILPTVGAIEGAPARSTGAFSHADEIAKPGYYRTKLDDVDVQVAATTVLRTPEQLHPVLRRRFRPPVRLLRHVAGQHGDAGLRLRGRSRLRRVGHVRHDTTSAGGFEGRDQLRERGQRLGQPAGREPWLVRGNSRLPDQGRLETSAVHSRD